MKLISLMTQLKLIQNKKKNNRKYNNDCILIKISIMKIYININNNNEIHKNII